MTGVAPPEPDTADLPLDGVLVVSLEQAVAAPLASQRLADAGARVIKIERPEGDFARGYDTAADGAAAEELRLGGPTQQGNRRGRDATDDKLGAKNPTHRMHPPSSLRPRQLSLFACWRAICSASLQNSC